MYRHNEYEAALSRRQIDVVNAILKIVYYRLYVYYITEPPLLKYSRPFNFSDQNDKKNNEQH